MATPTEIAVVAALAPHLDRLALCVHRPSSQNTRLREAFAALQPPPQSIVVVAARLLTSDDGVRPGDLALLSRYQPPSAMDAVARVHVERGLLVEREDGVLVATPEVRHAAQLVLDVQAGAAAELWGEPVEAADAAEAAVRAALENVGPAGAPAFVRQTETRPRRDGPTPTLRPTAAARLLDAVTELRYLKADAHAAALAAAGVRPKDASELTKRWKGFGEPLPTEDANKRGTIEDDTDDRLADALGATASPLLEALEPLAGDDPRPPEDR